MEAIHAFAREGEMDDLLKCIENGVLVNSRGLSLHGFFFYYYFLLLDVST